MDLPSMVERSGNTLIVRSVVSGNQLYVDQPSPTASSPPPSTNSNTETNNNNNDENNISPKDSPNKNETNPSQTKDQEHPDINQDDIKTEEAQVSKVVDIGIDSKDKEQPDIQEDLENKEITGTDVEMEDLAAVPSSKESENKDDHNEQEIAKESEKNSNDDDKKPNEQTDEKSLEETDFHADKGDQSSPASSPKSSLVIEEKPEDSEELPKSEVENSPSEQIEPEDSEDSEKPDESEELEGLANQASKDLSTKSLLINNHDNKKMAKDILNAIVENFANSTSPTLGLSAMSPKESAATVSHAAVNLTSSESIVSQAAEMTRILEQHFQQQSQQYQQNSPQQLPNDSSQIQPAEPKDEGLPQCKIKRNYSCSHCQYFTQNPRSHLMHLRDVHGEKIVINKCKLCLYASRHFQKLVRHMKMVHGCTDGITGANGQARGKRGMSRDVRKRKLEESVGIGLHSPPLGGSLSEMSTLEKIKREVQQHQLFIAGYGRLLSQQPIIPAENRPLLDQRNEAFQMPQTHLQQGQQQPIPQTLKIQRNSPSPSGSETPPGIMNNLGENSGQNRLMKCSVCDFTSLFSDQLLEHERIEHYKTQFYRCEKCTYVTHIKTRYSKHVKYHSMPMIKCVTCDFRTPYKWNLDRHMKNHGGAGPFRCAACDFTADIKQSLTVHEMNHHVPPVGHAAGMSLTRRRNKVGGTDLIDEMDPLILAEDNFDNSHGSDEGQGSNGEENYGKRCRYGDDDLPTDLSQKSGGSGSDTSSVHNQASDASPNNQERSIQNMLQLPNKEALNLTVESRSTLTEIAAMLRMNETLSEILQPYLKQNSPAQLSPTATNISSSSSCQNSRNNSQKKTPSDKLSIFEKLKANGGRHQDNLQCPCGHIAKSLSESILHRKTCNMSKIIDDDMEEEEPDDMDGRLEIDCTDEDERQSHSALNLSVSGSTRCQHCRHRCKSSADLYNHLKHCSEAIASNESFDSMSGESNNAHGNTNDWLTEHQQLQQINAMENRVIWNKISKNNNGKPTMGVSLVNMSGGSSSSLMNNSSTPNPSNSEESYCGVETAPGYGEVTKKLTPEEEAASSALKKVFKCPHCSFWASTASRFHVHIVGHLNKKPFECSLCSYRSNWRWDITKHIRLKTIRDPSHKNAKVLMNDETGRRNYTKYNKYITLMKVTEEDGDPKLMKSGEMTPNQVASLSFFNDYNNGNLMSSANNVLNSITLEPVSGPSTSNNNKQNDGSNNNNNLNEDDLIRIPILASWMNAAMAGQQKLQQEQQKQQQQQGATLITPSVTISAVKRSSPPTPKPSDDLITDVRQEGNEKKISYRCRKCHFRHHNRDAVLAHVKIHYEDPNYPIVTATLTSASKGSMKPGSNQQQQQQPQIGLSPPSITKILEAFCKSQQNDNQSQQQNCATTAHQDQQQHSIPFSIDCNNATLNSLALALAGKLTQQNNNNNNNNNTNNNNNININNNIIKKLGINGNNILKATNTVSSLIEHGEQNASQNEASAHLMTSPNELTIIPTKTLNGDTSNIHIINNNNNNNQNINNQNNLSTTRSNMSSRTSTSTSASSNATSSLQELLTLPRSSFPQKTSTITSTSSSTTTTTTSFGNVGVILTGVDNNGAKALETGASGSNGSGSNGGGGGDSITLSSNKIKIINILEGLGRKNNNDFDNENETSFTSSSNSNDGLTIVEDTPTVINRKQCHSNDMLNTNSNNEVTKTTKPNNLQTVTISFYEPSTSSAPSNIKSENLKTHDIKLNLGAGDHLKPLFIDGDNVMCSYDKNNTKDSFKNNLLIPSNINSSHNNSSSSNNSKTQTLPANAPASSASSTSISSNFSNLLLSLASPNQANDLNQLKPSSSNATVTSATAAASAAPTKASIFGLLSPLTSKSSVSTTAIGKMNLTNATTLTALPPSNRAARSSLDSQDQDSEMNPSRQNSIQNSKMFIQKPSPKSNESHKNNNNNNHNIDSPSLTIDCNNDRRGPSPYRCGHCRQVSNWKHVIQVL